MTEPQPERRAPDLSAVEIAKLEGRMDKGFAELNGRLDTMISEARSERELRVAAHAELRKDVDDHEARIRANTDDIAEVRATADKAVTPGKLWGVAASFGGLVIAAGAVVVNAIK